MPPKCCSIIPLSVIANLLDNAQIELYKAKYEEWATADRIYCPIPTCSTFIPPRMYTKTCQRPPVSYGDAGATATVLTPSAPNAFNNLKKETKPHVVCPTCDVSVCTKCRSLTHIGECPESDLDPALEEQLKKWKIKRCPKCRAGVRRMYGCSHIECRCGAHFCWECMLPINQCSVSS
jgi:IBR domain, a half RING-finger domain